MTLEQERQLVEAARKDPNQFGKLFDMYYQQIFDYIVRRVGDVPTAQDLASTVFYKAYQKLWQFKWRGLPFVAWLYRIASNEIKSHFRNQSSKIVSLNELKEEVGYEVADDQDLEAELLNAELALERHFDFLMLRKQLAQLDVKYQEVLHLKYFEKKKIDQISQILNKKPGTIKSLISRGLARLRKTMVKQPEMVTDLKALKPSFKFVPALLTQK